MGKRQWFLLGLCTVFVLTLVIGEVVYRSTRGGATTTPEGTINNFVSAVNAQNANKMLACEIYDMPGEYLRTVNSELLEMYSGYTIENIEIEKLSESDRRVECRVMFNRVTKSNGSIENMGVTFTLLAPIRHTHQSEEGVSTRWYIADLDPADFL